MLIFDVFFFLFSISFVCHAWTMKQLQIFNLLFRKNHILAIKRLGWGQKIRVGRVIGNKPIFLGLRDWNDIFPIASA